MEKIKEFIFLCFALIIWIPFFIIVILIYCIGYLVMSISEFIHDIIDGDSDGI